MTFQPRKDPACGCHFDWHAIGVIVGLAFE
jgi:hypothetical protein